MTVAEYAAKNNVSKQSVYGRLNRGTLQYKLIDGVRHIVESSVQPPLIESADYTTDSKSKKRLKRALKKLNKSVQRVEILTNKVEGLDALISSKDDEISTLKKALALFTVVLDKRLLAPDTDNEIVVKPKKSKKKR